MEPVVVFIVYQTARMGAPMGLVRPNCPGFLLLVAGSNGVKAFWSSFRRP